VDIAKIRAQIPATQRTIYLNTGFDGPAPISVVEAIQKRVAYENYEGPTTPPVLESGRSLTVQAKEAVARMVNVTPDEILMTQNTTEGLNVVLNGMDWRPGDELITLSIEYPSVMVLALHIQKRYGVRVRIAEVSPTESHAGLLAKVAEAVTPRTRALFMSHVHYLNGLRVPGAELAALAHRHGARLLLDGAQGLAHVDLDLRAMDVDFYSMPGQKWLCGPDGIGALYIKKDLIPSIQPTYASSRAAKSWLPTGEWEPETEAITKFQLTTTSAPLRAGYVEAIRFVQEEVGGTKAIEDRDTMLATAMKDALRRIPGVTVLSPARPPEATGIVTFSIAGKKPKDIVDALWAQKRIITRTIEPLGGVRLSCHFFNTEDEVATTAETIRGLAG
jgi:L-cysteine/cystine lyase